MTFLIITFSWAAALGVILTVNHRLAARRDAADLMAERTAAAVIAGTAR